MLSFSTFLPPHVAAILSDNVIVASITVTLTLWVWIFPWSSKLLEAAGTCSNAQRAAKNVTTCKCQCFSSKCFFLQFQILCCILMSLRSGIIMLDESRPTVTRSLFLQGSGKSLLTVQFCPIKCLIFCCYPEYSFIFGHLQGVTINFSCLTALQVPTESLKSGGNCFLSKNGPV